MITSRLDDQEAPGTIWAQLAHNAAVYTDKTAYVTVDDDGTRSEMTYGAMVTAAATLAGALEGLGVRRGDRVALWMTNRIDWLTTYFAVMRLGAVLVPLNTWLKPNEVEFILGHAGVSHLVMLDRFRQIRFADSVASLLADSPSSPASPLSPGSVSSTRLPDLRTVVVARRTASGERTHPHHDLHQLMAATSPSDEQAAADVGPDDLAFIKYTSGSTGFPKGVMWNHRGILRNARLHTDRLRLTSEDRFFSPMPFFHGGGSVWGIMSMLTRAGTLVFTEAFDPPVAAGLLESERCSVFFGVLGNEVLAAARKDQRDLRSVRISMTGGPDAAELMPNSRAIIRPFGLTETYGPFSLADADDPEVKQLGTNARPFEGNEIRAVDPDTGQDVAPGVVAEAWVRGLITHGYWNDPEGTAAAIDQDGWLHSGDLVSIDDEGYITFVGRLKLMLKVGGENVSVEEVERQIEEHPDIQECAVVGVPDQRKREMARAYVVLRPGATTSVEDVMTWLSGRMARFKLPREIVVLDQIPHLANGKRNRKLIQEQALSDPMPVASA